MTEFEISNKYFNWMCHTINSAGNSRYKKLLSYLQNIDFYYTLAMDANRYEDGISLRYRFGYESNVDQFVISECLDNKQCSILEMLISLSMRCEEHIMDDPDIGNRTDQWFWMMIKNMGLHIFNDSNFNEKKVDEIIHRFLEREYESNGSGGLFIIENSENDLSTVEIWTQLCWYLDSIL